MNETGEFSTLLRDDRAPDDAGIAFLLSVVEGPDRGASLLVDASLPSRAFAGTSSTCELRLNDHDVSRRHVAFEVNGEMRQQDSVGRLVLDVPALIEHAASVMTLHPGDVIFSGTPPKSVGPVRPGDVMVARMDRIGAMRVLVRGGPGRRTPE